MPLTAEVFLGARLFGHTFFYALKFTFYLTQISPNETAAICRDFKETTMFGQCPRHRFLLLWRIFRASPIEECAKFILFLPAAHAAQGEKVKSAVLTFSIINKMI